MIKDKKLYKILTDRLHSQGWDNNTHFARSSGIPYTRETTSRAFEKHSSRHIANDTLATVLKFLNYKPMEIKEFLKEYTDDNEIWPMIQIDGPELTKQEEAILDMTRQLGNEQAYLGYLANQFEMLAKAAGLDFTNQIAILRRQSKHPKK